MLLERRNRLNVGICCRMSSATTAGASLMSSRVITLTLAGTSPSRCSLRVGVTVTASEMPAGWSVTSRLCVADAAGIVRRNSAKPPDRTMRVTSPDAAAVTVNFPSEPVTACRSAPDDKAKHDGRAVDDTASGIVHDPGDGDGRR